MHAKACARAARRARRRRSACRRRRSGNPSPRSMSTGRRRRRWTWPRPSAPCRAASGRGFGPRRSSPWSRWIGTGTSRPGRSRASGRGRTLRAARRPACGLSSAQRRSWRRAVRCCPGRRTAGIFGYSLGGLMALYALCESRSFGLCGALSASLWYEGFLDYLRERAPAPGRAGVPLPGQKGGEGPLPALCPRGRRRAPGAQSPRRAPRGGKRALAVVRRRPRHRARAPDARRAQVAAGAAMIQARPRNRPVPGGRAALYSRNSARIPLHSARSSSAAQ